MQGNKKVNDKTVRLTQPQQTHKSTTKVKGIVCIEIGGVRGVSRPANPS